MQRFATALAISALVFCSVASAASLYDIDPHMRKDAECMVGVLKTVPGIDQLKLGVQQEPSMDFRRPPTKEIVPYLQYRAVADKGGYRAVVRFWAETSRTADGKVSYYFMTMLSGLFSSRDRGPNDWGASAIEARWKAECGVESTILFE